MTIEASLRAAKRSGFAMLPLTCALLKFDMITSGLVGSCMLVHWNVLQDALERPATMSSRDLSRFSRSGLGFEKRQVQLAFDDVQNQGQMRVDFGSMKWNIVETQVKTEPVSFIFLYTSWLDVSGITGCTLELTLLVRYWHNISHSKDL